MSFTTKEKILLALFSEVDTHLTDEVLRAKLLIVARTMICKSKNRTKRCLRTKKKIS